MKVGDLVTWPEHDLDSESCGLWRVIRIGYMEHREKYQYPEEGVTVRWLGGYRRYPDQRKSRRLLKEVRLVDDPLVAITKLVENEMEAIALVANLP